MEDPARYPPALASILAKVPLAPLGPGSPAEAMRPELEDATLFAGLQGEAASACRAGLWLAFDFLDESHAVSQELLTREGSYWHAIMHRREPDAGNSKYWWRRVGSHPVLDRLRERSPGVGYRFTSPDDFVDFCERVRGSGGAEEDLARWVQRLEWDLLFAWCFRLAAGGAERRG